jgi:hypothetical protein
MSIHRSLCIPLPLGRLSQRISRISTHSSGALYPGFSPTTLGPTISSGTHRYAVASPSEVGWVGGWRGAREVAPTRGNSPDGAKEPLALGGQRAGNEGGHDRSPGSMGRNQGDIGPHHRCQPRLPSRRVVRSPVLSCGARQSHHSAYSKAFRVIAFASCGAPSLLRQRCRIPVSAFPIHVQYCQPASCHLLLSRHIRPSMTTRRLTASPIIRGSILRNSSHSVNTRSTSALSHAALAESA